jgi:hypothetical protein
MPWRSGGVIGQKNAPRLPAASGVWRLPEIEAAQRDPAAWPVPNALPVTSGVLAWLDANEANTLLTEVGGSTAVSMNGAIAQWSDRSGGGRHASQATSGSRPILATSAGNNRRCVRFDGVDDFVTGTHGAGSNSAHTVIAAFRTASGGAGSDKSAILLGNRADGSGSPRAFYGIPYTYQSETYGVYAPFRQASAGITRSVIPFLACSYRINTTNTRIGVHSLQQLTSPVPRNFYNLITLLPLNLTNALEIGRSSSAGGVSFTSMDVHEVIVYNSSLSDSDVNRIVDYLASKWGTV